MWFFILPLIETSGNNVMGRCLDGPTRNWCEIVAKLRQSMESLDFLIAFAKGPIHGWQIDSYSKIFTTSNPSILGAHNFDSLRKSTWLAGKTPAKFDDTETQFLSAISQDLQCSCEASWHLSQQVLGKVQRLGYGFGIWRIQGKRAQKMIPI